MELEDQYKAFSNDQLLRIIELPEAYTSKAQKTAKLILESRIILKSSLIEMSKDLWLNYCKENFKQIIGDSIKLNSHFLDKSELKQIMDRAYEYHKERQELFEIDLKKYWGAIF